MKKKVFGKSILLTLFTIIIVSCSNMSHSSTLVSEFAKEIEYQKSPYVSVQIAVDDKNSYKSLIPAQNIYDKKYKKTDTINLSIEVTNKYSFIEWQAFPDEENKYVEFKDPKSPETIATILRDDAPIKIIPKCIIDPEIESVAPNSVVYNYPKDTIIEITFNQKIDSKIFSDEEHIFKNIQIISEEDGKTLSEDFTYFMKPDFISEEEKYKLIIRPNIKGITELFSNGKETQLITVTLDVANIYAEMAGSKDNSQDIKSGKIAEKYSFSFNIVNSVKDTEKAQFVNKAGFDIALTEENVLKEENEYHVKAFNINNYGETAIDEKDSGGPSDITEQDKDKVVIGDKIWIKAKVLDNNNNLQKIVIGEQSLNNYNPNLIGQLLETEYFAYDDSISFDSESNVYTFLQEYSLRTKTDGYVRLFFTAYDASGIPLTASADVIRLSDLPVPTIYRNEPQISGKKTSEDLDITVIFDTAIEYELLQEDLQAAGNAPLFTYSRGASSLEFNEEINPVYVKIDAISYSSDGINYTACNNLQSKSFYLMNENEIQSYCPGAASSIKRNAEKDCYIKIDYSDIWGTKKLVIQKIQKNLSIADVNYNDNDGTINFTLLTKPEANYYVFCKYNPPETDLNLSGNVYDYLPIYKTLEENTKYYFNFSQESDTFNLFEQNTDYTNNGRYDLYVMPLTENNPDEFIEINDYSKFFELTGITTFNEPETDSDIGKQILLYPLCGNLGEEFSLYKGIDSPEIPEIPIDAIPEYIDSEITANPPNSGTHTIKLIYPEGFIKNSSYWYKYVIKNLKTGNETTYYTEEFEVETGNSYIITLYIINKKGGEPNEVWISDTLYANVASNKSPAWAETVNWEFTYNSSNVHITTMPSMLSSGSVYTKYKYWITTDDNLSYDELIKRKYYVYRNEPDYMDICFNGQNGNYVYVLIESGNNYSLRTININRIEGSEKIEFDINSQNKIELKGSETSLWLKAYEKNEKKWKTPEQKTSLDKTFEIDPNTYNTFVQVACDIYDDSADAECNIKTNYRYFINPYVYFSTQKNGYENSLRNIVEGSNGLTVFSDYPVFIHKMYNAEDFGDDIQKWEKYGMEIDSCYSEGSITYKNIYFSEYNVRRGGYYKLIVYFADGIATSNDSEYVWYSDSMYYDEYGIW